MKLLSIERVLKKKRCKMYGLYLRYRKVINGRAIDPKMMCSNLANVSVIRGHRQSKIFIDIYREISNVGSMKYNEEPLSPTYRFRLISSCALLILFSGVGPVTERYLKLAKFIDAWLLIIELRG